MLAKFALTIAGTVILLVHMRAVSTMAHAAATTTHAGEELGHMRIELVVHAAGGLLLLIVATTLSVYKPWGKTGYGRRARALAS